MYVCIIYMYIYLYISLIPKYEVLRLGNWGVKMCNLFRIIK